LISTTNLLPAVNQHIKSNLNFNLPATLEASEPPEARGLSRDEVRLMVSYQSNNRITHTQFNQLGDYLTPGDLLVINTSGTLNAALTVTRADGTPLELHLSTQLPADLWLVELRQPDIVTTRPFFKGQTGEILQLPGGVEATLLTPYQANHRLATSDAVRLWIARLTLPQPDVVTYLDEYGFPIRYNYVNQAWPSDYYQTIYATEPGSAEMPSAGRAFTPPLLTRLIAKGIQIAPLILHTGVASLETNEPPYEEYYRVPAETAYLVNQAHKSNKRVVAVGTTVVRALETVTDSNGQTNPGEGWTKLFITPERGVRAVDGLLTGFHEPKATHLAMLQALTGLPHLEIAYAQAIEHGYLWHEFGDLHLIL